MASDEPVPDMADLVLEKAAKVAVALEQQITNVEQHVDRVTTLRDRYTQGNLIWSSIDLQRAYWEELLTVLRAVQQGKTVQPS